MSSNPYINNIYKRWKDIKEYVDTRIQFRSLIDRKEIKALLDEKQDKLVAGKNITIKNNVISAIIPKVDLSPIEEQLNNLNIEVDEIKDSLENITTITKQQIEALFRIDVVIFTAEKDNSSIGLNRLSTNQTLEYSMDDVNWNNMDTSTVINLANVGDSVYIRGILSADNTTSNYTQFYMSGKIAARGNCNAIWNYQDLNAPLKAYCGYKMFLLCTELTTAPKLPAVTLAKCCYGYMFNTCHSLTATPELPATELAEECYKVMFGGCTALTNAPDLPATTLAPYCYQTMFKNCSSLKTAPKLPATTLAHSCYSDMFTNCSSLKTAPKLPATTLARSCYVLMFFKCTSLTTAPELPATTLAENCYCDMFENCTNLNHIKCLATDISATNCTYNWVNGISSTGIFVKHPDMNSWSTGTSGIPENWTVEDDENSINPNKYNLIDLGLPSGLKWADRNVGASSPEDAGLYFSWGNVDGHAVDESGNVVDYSFDSDTYSTTSGGQYTGSTLDAEHDAATVNMGSEWRMPTSAETLELVENTDHYYIDLSGNTVAKSELDGSKLRSICFVKKGEAFDYKNGTNFIEFPFAGSCDGSLLGNEGLLGYVWSSSVREGNVEYALGLYFNSGGLLRANHYNYRYGGRSVRGVRA